jgi:transaldolase
MEIFVDSSKIDEIKKWNDMGVVDGATTNPSIMLKDGITDIEGESKKIAKMIYPKPLSVEVTTNDLDEMIIQARRFASGAPNIVVKIPNINQDGVPCFGVVRQLEHEGIKVNCTAILSLGQVVLAAKAGATYISIFAGRISDEGGDAAQVIMNSVEFVERWKYKSKILVGSIRSVGDALSAVLAGAHILTIPPALIGKMADHKYTRETVRQFVDDAQKATQIIEKGK